MLCLEYHLQSEGTSFNRMDEVLAKYAELNYKKHYNDNMRVTLALSANDIDLAKQVAHTDAEVKTCKDIYDAMQALEYEVNTLFSSNGQLAV